MSSLSLKGGLDSLRRISFGNTTKPIRYFEPEDSSSLYPNVFINSIIFLEKYGLDKEGIMRVNGKLSEINAVRSLLTEDKLAELTEKDVHTVASVLKAFFTESPQPILPEDKYLELVSLAQAEQSERVISELKSIISALPMNLQRILHRLILFAEKIHQNSRVNKMEILSLAVILGPMLLRSPVVHGASQQFQNNAACVKVAFKLMEYHNSIFEIIEQDIEKAKAQIEAIKSSSNRHSFKFVRGLADSVGLKALNGSPPVSQNLKLSDGVQDQASKRSSGLFVPSSLSVPDQAVKRTSGSFAPSTLSVPDQAVKRISGSFASTLSVPDQAAKRTSGSFAASRLSVEQPGQSRRSSTGLVNISARAYYESLVNDMTIAYAAAKDSRAGVLLAAIKNAVNEWQRLKEDALEQEQLFSVVNDKYLAFKECFARATKSKEDATSELARLRAVYLVSDDSKWETQSGTPLLIDEIAHLQEIQALVDLREAEFKLITEQKVVAEMPLEMAQGALWKAVAELKRLGLTEDDAATWDNQQTQYPTKT